MRTLSKRKIKKAKELLTEAINIFEKPYYSEEQEVKHILEQTIIKVRNVEENNK
ncbi:hypothetical protein KQI61_04470 [Anaerocolumna aminovalerica]|uniref:hypothetical protein n=1 Tax=Anaerocolumna aminovalerica TaxID=1527 RepID=UPI001C0EE94F|nr:hypothetical protein [Anaerocolumna aminovalerica]MBU5331442.1 hypothetical protein [Anaerocolumna aminovalerica]